MARRRQLSAEEVALWRSVADTANPMRARGSQSPPDQPSSLQTARRPQPERGFTLADFSAGVAARPHRTQIDLVPDPHDALSTALPDMDRRKYRKLRRGRLDPDARIDLHGMTAERAHEALTSFVLGASGMGQRLVLVITGKGRAGDADAMTPHRRGVLRHAVPHWLSLPPLSLHVLQIAPAHVKHGGAGAYYVYLRRKR